VINAGGVLRAVGLETLGWDEGTLAERLEQIGETLTEIYRRADDEAVSTEVVAARLADEKLASAAR
jgi:leucine dehydrogenase